MDAKLLTQSGPFFKARSTNTTDNGFPSRIPTVTTPTGTGNNAAQATASAVIDIGPSPKDGGIVSGVAQNGIVIVPFGAGADNATASMRLIGWRNCGADSHQTEIWVPVVLGEWAYVLSTAVGIAGMTVTSTDRLADTITLTYPAAATVSIETVSNGQNFIAHIMADIKGFQKIELTFTTGGSATNCNALYALL